MRTSVNVIGTVAAAGIRLAHVWRMAKKKTARRSSQKRDAVKTPNATLYAKRTTRGRFKDMDEKGRSLTTDRRRKAKSKTKSGYGDRGDRPVA